MTNTSIWITYHDEKQIEQYNLQEDDTFHLFKGNDILHIKGENINLLNPFYCELVTLYYVWKNHLYSNKVGFCHYRRVFREILDIEDGVCQTLAINKNHPIFAHYKASHNYQDLYDIVDILNKHYGEKNKYSTYLLEGRVFIPFCCFIMKWNDFNRLCKFLFPILEAFDRKNNLNMNPQKYIEKANKDFRYDNIDYQKRAIAFLGERLISCFLVCEMKNYCLNEL